MIDPKIIREDVEGIRDLLVRRNMQDAVDVDELKRVDEKRRDIVTRSDELRKKRNSI